MGKRYATLTCSVPVSAILPAKHAQCFSFASAHIAPETIASVPQRMCNHRDLGATSAQPIRRPRGVAAAIFQASKRSGLFLLVRDDPIDNTRWSTRIVARAFGPPLGLKRVATEVESSQRSLMPVEVPRL
jgi:hypothetical protein